MAAARRSRRRSPGSNRWPLLLGFLVTVAVVGIGALVWSRTQRGQAALLHLGADALYTDVQSQIDTALSQMLPGYADGSSSDGDLADAYDWPLPAQGDAAVIRCRLVPVTADATWWQVQARIDDGLRTAGGRVLWGERLGRPRRARANERPDERRDLLRLDIGVPGRATHSLLCYRAGTERPPVRWGGDPATSAWRQLQAAGDAPTVAICIDDWGYRDDAICRGLLTLDVPLTMAVLPGLPYSRRFALAGTDLALPPQGATGTGSAAREAADRRHRAGCPVTLGLGFDAGSLAVRRREVMLHLPMESQRYPDLDPGPDAVMVGMGRQRIGAVLDKALASLPNVRGINNHQGSAATADEATMESLMAELAERGLFYFDSLTTARSVAYASARAAGLPAARNRAFLDHDHQDRQRIRANLEKLVRSARSGGFAVGIGHPHASTLAVLREELPRLRREGVRFVTLSELLALEGATR